jgi:F-type H+-transporting ATPase subunit gamma
MPSLKDLDIRIGATEKIRQITNTMKLVATSRMRSTQLNMEAFRPYAEKFTEVLGSIASKTEAEANALLVPRERVDNIHLVLCTSDRGLCGGFNANLIAKAESFVNKKSAGDVQISLTNFGKKGRDWARKTKKNIVNEHIDVIGSKVKFSVASNETQKWVGGFLDGTYDEVYVIYAKFVNMASQLPVLQQLLPIPPIESNESTDEGDEVLLAEHICEPPPVELLGELLPRSIAVQLHSALLETSTSENAARMTAMDNATKACDDMIDELTLARNKARQAAITAELMDIVGGAEALKG